jgi:hypothetical protein
LTVPSKVNEFKPGRFFGAGLGAVLLLGAFIVTNSQLAFQDSHKALSPFAGIEREHIPPGLSLQEKKLAFHDFESGNVSDSASHLASTGHGGKQSLVLSPLASFSPGLWIKFKELDPPDSSWIRVTGYVWFSCPPAEAKCSLVATCNHRGINYKYMFIPFETENLQPNRWNRVSIDYRIPRAPDRDDVLQAYFWNRGNERLLVDDINVALFTNQNR